MALVLLVLDAYAVRGLGLGGLDHASGQRYWAGALTVVAAVALASTVAEPLRTTRLAAATVGQLPVWLLVTEFGRIGAAAVLVAQAGTLAGLVIHAGRLPRDVRVALAIGLPPAWAGGAVIAFGAGAAPGAPAWTIVSATLVLLTAAAVAAALAATLRHVLAGETAAGAATLALLGCVGVIDVHAVTHPYESVGMQVAAAALLAALTLLPPARPTGSAAVSLLVAAVFAVPSAHAVELAVFGPLAWPFEGRWSAVLPAGTRDLVAPHMSWPGGWVDVVATLVAAGTAVIAVHVLTGRRRLATATAAGGALLLLPVLVIAADLPWVPVVVAGTGLGGAGLVLAALGGTPLQLGVAGWLLATATAWSLADQTTSLVCLTLALAATGTAAVVVSAPAARPALVMAAVGLAAADTAALARAADAPYPHTGCYLVGLAGAVAAGSAAAARRLQPPDRRALELSAAVVAAAGIVTTGGDNAWTTLALTLAAVAATAVAVRRDRYSVRYLAAGLLAAASAHRLVTAQGAAIETYVLPPALALLVLGALSRAEGPRRGSRHPRPGSPMGRGSRSGCCRACWPGSMT